jgi:hypothetical protein
LITRQAGKWPSQRGGMDCWRKRKNWRSFATQKLESWSSLAPASSMISPAPGQISRSLWYIYIYIFAVYCTTFLILFFRDNAMVLSLSVSLICVSDQVSYVLRIVILWSCSSIDPKVVLLTCVIMRFVMCATVLYLFPSFLLFFFFF